MTAGVYLLRDPNNGIVRYVGKSRNVEKRLSQHWSSRSGGVRLSRWMEELYLCGLRPIVVVFRVDEATLDKVESIYIRRYWSSSFNGVMDGVLRDDVIFPAAKVTAYTVFYAVRDAYVIKLVRRAVGFGFNAWKLRQGFDVLNRSCRFALRRLQNNKRSPELFRSCWLKNGYTLTCEDPSILDVKAFIREPL